MTSKRKDDIVYINPKNPQVFELAERFQGKRHCALDNLKIVKNEQGKFCSWCLKKSSRKYCCGNCHYSAWAFFYPGRWAYRWLLIRQDGACLHCGYLFDSSEKDDFASGIGKEVDHVIPIHKGGKSFGMDNLQLLCKKCHTIKSANERRKPLVNE